MIEGDGVDIAYLPVEELYRAAAEALGTDLATVRAVTNDTLAGSALAAPSAGFGDFEKLTRVCDEDGRLVASCGKRPRVAGRQRADGVAVRHPLRRSERVSLGATRR